MEQQPLVSVIINCYNGEKYLREAIDSVIAQTYTNWEIIFWDNQSNDSTAEIVKSYKDNRIRYFYAPEHTPLGEARNLAMKEVRGEFIGFLDSDDTWEPCLLVTYIKYINLYPEIALFYSKYFAKDGNRCWYSNQRKDVVEWKIGDFIKKYDIGMSSALVKKSIIDNYRLSFDNRFSMIEDYDFFIRVAIKGGVVALPESLMTYRYHEENLSKQDKWVEELDFLCSFIKNDCSGYNSHKPYLVIFKVLRNHYLIYQLIRKKRRFSALKKILQTAILDISILRLIGALILGVDFAKKYRNIVNK